MKTFNLGKRPHMGQETYWIVTGPYADRPAICSNFVSEVLKTPEHELPQRLTLKLSLEPFDGCSELIWADGIHVILPAHGNYQRSIFLAISDIFKEMFFGQTGDKVYWKLENTDFVQQYKKLTE